MVRLEDSVFLVQMRIFFFFVVLSEELLHASLHISTVKCTSWHLPPRTCFLTLKSLLFVAFLSENKIIGPTQPHTASKVVHHGQITMHIHVMFTLLVKENKA